jgi:two-component system, NarL family, nitrate/nitrite response regulator NarL
MTARATIRVLVVDDHTLFRRGLTALLGAQAQFLVVGEAGDAGEALRRAADLQPDVILLDNHLPGVHGVDAIQGLREVAPRARILMLTVSEDGSTLARALQQGAHGYLLKTVDSDVLAGAIERAVRGESTISPEMTGKLVTAYQALQAAPQAATTGPAPDGFKALSPREQQILAEIARGASNKEIARTLDIAETTVKIHVQHILRKLNLTSRVQAAVYLTSRGQ